MKTPLRPAVAILSAVLFSACGGSSDEAPSGGGGAAPPSLSQSSVAPVAVKVSSESALSDAQRVVLAKIRSGEHPSPDEIRVALLSVSIERAVPRRRRMQEANNLLAFLLGIASGDAHGFKIAIDEALEQKHGRVTRYNRDRSDALAPYLQNLMQCYSGTVFFELARRFSGGITGYGSAHPVVIAQAGHVLPGYMAEDYYQRWHLYGIETTVSGRGQIYFGPAGEQTGAIRVVRADDFAIFEIFRDDLTNAAPALDQALAAAAQLYTFPSLASETAVASHHRVARILRGGNPLFFGDSDVAPGTRARADMDSQSLSGGFIYPADLLNPPTPPSSVEGAQFFGSAGANCTTAGGQVGSLVEGRVGGGIICLPNPEPYICSTGGRYGYGDMLLAMCPCESAPAAAPAPGHSGRSALSCGGFTPVFMGPTGPDAGGASGYYYRVSAALIPGSGLPHAVAEHFVWTANRYWIWY